MHKEGNSWKHSSISAKLTKYRVATDCVGWQDDVESERTPNAKINYSTQQCCAVKNVAKEGRSHEDRAGKQRQIT